MTTQMSENVDTLDRVEQIINMLKFLTYNGDCVDGETMQYIIERVGMDWQMLRQLILTMPLEQVEYLVEERKDLNK
jgi:tRNA-dihydrouridine synthase